MRDPRRAMEDAAIWGAIILAVVGFCVTTAIYYGWRIGVAP